MSDPAPHIFTVRGRPVEFRPSSFFGGLYAVERGPFPISPTGFRSLAGHMHQFGPGNPEDISPAFLESLAEAQDKENKALLARLRRAPRDRDFISVSMTAEMALDHGFFAPPEVRVALWQGAYRLLCQIDMDPQCQPKAYSAAWSPEHCATALDEERALLAFVRQLATGDFPAEATIKQFGARAYLALPPKPEGEAGFALPAIASEFAFDLSGPEASDDDSEDEDEEDTEEAEETDADETDEDAPEETEEDADAPQAEAVKLDHSAPPKVSPAVQLGLF